MANMIQPLPLIEYSERGELVVNDEAIAVLENIQPPIMVVGISGRYREGKSYLANLLAGIATESKKFPLGSTVESKTKGIWFYCREHPNDRSTTVILLDSEGLDDPKKTDQKSELVLLTLTLLQSTAFILNVTMKIDDSVFQLLQYVAEVSDKYIKADSSRDCGPEALKPYYPALYLVLRDFYLQEVVDGRELTGDEYFEDCLALKSGTSRAINEYNQPRMTIKACFQNRNCVFMHRPVSNESDLRNLDSIPKGNLTADFRREMAELERKLFAEKKRFSVHGDMLDGRGWLSFLKNNLEIFKRGGVPVLRHAYDAVVAEDNKNAFSRAERVYKEEMEERLKQIMETDELIDVHSQCKEDALKCFRKNAKGNKCDVDTLEKTLKDKISQQFDGYVEKNKHESQKFCKTLLENLYAPIVRAIGKGDYTMPGGFDSYSQDQNEVVQLYSNEQGKGPAAEETSKNFFVEKEGEASAIRQADINLRDRDSDIAERLEREVQVSGSPYDRGKNSVTVKPREPEVFPVCSSSSEKAFKEYKSEMEKKMQPEEPLEAEVLAENHRLAREKSLDKFDRETKDLKGVIKDDIRGKLEGFIESMFHEYECLNKTTSERKCRQLLKNLFKEVDEKIKNGSYNQPGGHSLYLEDRDECRALYNNEPNKGPAAEEVIDNYLVERVDESCEIFKADQKITEEDRLYASRLHQEGSGSSAASAIFDYFGWSQKK